MCEKETLARALVEKILELPPERIVEVEEFEDFLRSRLQETALTHSASTLSEGKLRELWGNPDDVAFDKVGIPRRHPGALLGAWFRYRKCVNSRRRPTTMRAPSGGPSTEDSACRWGGAMAVRAFSWLS